MFPKYIPYRVRRRRGPSRFSGRTWDLVAYGLVGSLLLGGAIIATLYLGTGEPVRSSGADVTGPLERVVDGDTLLLEGQRIRLAGLDAPETRPDLHRSGGQAVGLRRSGGRPPEGVGARAAIALRAAGPRPLWPAAGDLLRRRHAILGASSSPRGSRYPFMLIAARRAPRAAPAAGCGRAPSSFPPTGAGTAAARPSRRARRAPAIPAASSASSAGSRGFCPIDWRNKIALTGQLGVRYLRHIQIAYDFSQTDFK